MSSSRITAAKIKRAQSEATQRQNGPPSQQQQHYQQQQTLSQNAIPKMSISDAIALITLRLGKVENIVQVLHSNTDSEGDFLTNYDDVFEDILQRLTKLESGELNNNNNNLDNNSNNDLETKKEIISIRSEMTGIKDMVMKMQQFMIESNQKLCSLQDRQDRQERFNSQQQQCTSMELVPVSNNRSIDL
jgi:hypothetical protein